MQIFVFRPNLDRRDPCKWVLNKMTAFLLNCRCQDRFHPSIHLVLFLLLSSLAAILPNAMHASFLKSSRNVFRTSRFFASISCLCVICLILVKSVALFDAAWIHAYIYIYREECIVCCSGECRARVRSHALCFDVARCRVLQFLCLSRLCQSFVIHNINCSQCEMLLF